MGRQAVRTLLAMLVLVLSVQLARADSDPREEATRIMQSAIETHEAGDYLAALEGFNKAYALYPSARLKYNLGRVLSDLGRDLEALEAFEEYLAKVPDASEKTRAVAEAKIAVLKEKVGYLKVRCTSAGADVRVDGKIIGKGPLDSALRVMPGDHLVASELSGYQPFLSTVDVRGGKPTEVVVKLVKPKPVYKKAWFWATIGGVVAAAAATSIALGVTYGTRYPPVELKGGTPAGLNGSSQ